MLLHTTPLGELFGRSRSLHGLNEQIEVSVNGERVALLDINPRMSETDRRTG